MSPPFFIPENMIVNNSNNLLAVSGSNGVIVFELPERCPPYGCFSSNKEMIYCRTHSLHERTLAFSTKIEVRQVRFHPGSPNDNHIVFLTNDNILRVYNIKSSGAICTGIYGVGQKPGANMPSSKISMIEALGETAVDFDFAPPELESPEKPQLNTSFTNTSLSTYTANTSLQNAISSLKIDDDDNKKDKKPGLIWPIFFLYGDGEIYTITINLANQNHPGLKGPHLISPKPKGVDFCSIICIPSTPPVLAMANHSGKVFHVLVLPDQSDSTTNEIISNDDVSYLQRQDKTLLLLETMELELGLNTTHISTEYSCPIYLHRDQSKMGNYFATHETGVHFVSVGCVDLLQKFLYTENDDQVLQEIVDEVSTVEYLLCTKTTTIEEINPVIGFDTYHDPQSIVVLLGNGQLVTLAMITMQLPPHEYTNGENLENMNSPLKSILSNPFDAQIQRILRQASTQPILKLSSNGEKTQQECYELLQRATQVFRDEHFKHYDKAREEIEKRVKALKMLKDFQIKEVDRMTAEKAILQENAENLAEKYEDMKENQEELTKRCEKLLILISKMHSVPSNAEKQYHQQLKDYEKKSEKYIDCIGKLKKKIMYQDVQMKNWTNHNKKTLGLGSEHASAIKTNLQDSTNKISAMVKEINEYKRQLNIA